MEGAEPSLNVGGVPAGDQAAALQGTQLGGRIWAGCDHLVEGVLQGHGVIMGALVLGGGKRWAWHTEYKGEATCCGTTAYEVQETLDQRLALSSSPAPALIAIRSQEVTGPAALRSPSPQDGHRTGHGFPCTGHHTPSLRFLPDPQTNMC